MRVYNFQVIGRVCFSMLRIQRAPATVVPAVSGYYLAGASEPAHLLMLAFAIVFFYASASSLNDLADYEADKINSPDRLLVKGVISRRQVWFLSTTLLLLGLLLIGILDWLLFAIAATLGLILEVSYNFGVKLKNSPVGSVIYLSLSTSAIPFLGGFIIMRNLNTVSIALAFFLAIFTSSATIGSLRDISGDAQAGKRTIAVALGEKKARQLVLTLILIPILAYPALWLIFDFLQVYILYAVVPVSLRLLIGFMLLTRHKIDTPRILTRLLIVIDFTIIALSRPENGFSWL